MKIQADARANYQTSDLLSNGFCFAGTALKQIWQ